LSGFLMSMMLEREKHVGFREIGHFYYRRVRRILPSYLLVILLSLVASRCFLLRYLQIDNLKSAVNAVIFITNIKAADSVGKYLKMVSSTKTTKKRWYESVSA
uniref:EXS domain-containing protein n=1 Tax=Angiostrongylus cantonensis TaxID=6313 RepID=A0A0K0DPW4_ANGCA